MAAEAPVMLIAMEAAMAFVPICDAPITWVISDAFPMNAGALLARV
jgi:hypothetical protein